MEKKQANNRYKQFLFLFFFPTKMLQKNSPKLLILLLITSSILGFLCIDNGHNWADDFAMYLSQCQALQDGSMQALYEQNRFAMDNSYGNVGPYLYPNGFPTLLVPIYKIFEMNFWVLKIYCFCFFIASLSLIYQLFRLEQFDSKQALTITCLIGLNYHFIRFSDHILSDLPFFFFSLFCLLLILKQRFKNLVQSLILGSLIFLSYHIRDIGILLFTALFVQQFQLYKSKKLEVNLNLLLPYFIFVILWFIRHQLSPITADRHLEFLSNTSLEIILNNCYYYALLIGNYFVIFQVIPPFVQVIISVIFIVIILIGIIKNTSKNWTILVYLLSTFGLYFVWVSFQGMRFIFPLLPFLLYYLIKGLEQLFQQEKQLNMVLSFLLWTSLAQSLLTSYHYYKTDTNEAYSQDLQQVYQYIKKELPSDAIIVFQKPRALRLFSGRNAVQKKIPTAHYELVPTQKNNANILFQTPSYTLILCK